MLLESVQNTSHYRPKRIEETRLACYLQKLLGKVGEALNSITEMQLQNTHQEVKEVGGAKRRGAQSVD